MSANSANRTQNFSSRTSRKAIGRPSLSEPNAAEALLEPPSNTTSLPCFKFWNCESVPFLHRETNGPQACDVTGLKSEDTAPVTEL